MVGAGVRGADHVRTLRDRIPEAVVVAVSDVDATRAGAAAASAGDGVRALADPHELIADDDVDAVVVASSDHTHEELVLACLAGSKPVLCEKPLATTAAASLRITRVGAALGRRLVQVGFMRRCDMGAAQLHARDAHHQRGDSRDRHRPVAHGAGGGRRHRLHPRTTSRAAAGLRDPQLVSLETRNGVLIDIEIFVNARYGYEICCELVGEAGTVAIPSAVSADFRGPFAQAYEDELRAWVGGVSDRGPAGPSAWDGYAASAVADACLGSLACGRPAAVELEVRPELYA